jgi:hypothetical protein
MFPLGARKVSQFQARSGSGSPSSSSPPGQLGARLIQVHLERLDNTGALAAAEIEVTVAGTEPLDLVAIPGRRFRSVSLVEGHLRTQGSRRRTGPRPRSPRQGCPAGPDFWILMTPRFTHDVLSADRQARIRDLPDAAAVAFRGDGGPSLFTGKPWAWRPVSLGAAVLAVPR